MRFDDRLSTVLGLKADAPRDRAVQWRQLVELVARGGGGSDPALLGRALERIALLRPEVPEAVRASAARSLAGPGVPAGLIASFAADRLDIAAPMLRAADLDAAGWALVRAGASPEVRELVNTISPPPRPVPRTSDERPAAATVDPASFQQRGLFRWETNSSGEIHSVDGAPRAAIVGLSLAREFGPTFTAQLPFDAEPVSFAEDGPLSGEWLWTGMPRFDRGSGRFEGYAGYARREGEQASATSLDVASPATADSDSLRELIHELRTPLTAIIGFGEIIEGQLLGPAHRAYRTRAGEIVRQARRLLGAVEELDLAAKLRSARAEPAATATVAELTDWIGQTIGSLAEARGVRLRTAVRNPQDRFSTDRVLLERLLQRFLEAVIGAAAAGEQLTLTADRIGSQLALSLDRPAAGADLPEERLLDPAFAAGEDQGLGLGFSLRLVRGLAAVAGGSLDVGTDRLVLLLPAAQSATP